MDWSALLGIPVPWSWPAEYLYPALLWLLIPAAIILLWLTRSSFVRDNPRFDDAASTKRRSKLRWTVFVMRLLAIACLILALATPLVKQSAVRAGDTHITVLVDNSSSMAEMDTDFLPKLLSDLRTQVPVTVRTITPGEQTALGDAILANLKPGENLLLVTDGQSNVGQSLPDAFAFASQMNSTVSAIKLDARIEDAAVSLDLPDKAIAGTNVTFGVRISRTKDLPVKLRVLVDDITIYNDTEKASQIVLEHAFERGTHKISAILDTEDANPKNNRYDALLTVVDKPQVLVVAKRNTGLEVLLRQLYRVNRTDSIPKTEDELKGYYMIALIDLPAQDITPATTMLTQYVLDGNGLLVAGGPTSYDYGAYKSAIFENLLPVSVGKGKEQAGVTNIVVVLDLSSAGEGSYQTVDGQLVYQKSNRAAIIRSLGAAVIQDLNANSNVGAIATGSASNNSLDNLAASGDLIMWDYVGGQAVGKVSVLGPKRDKLVSAAQTMRAGGQSASQLWVAAPLKALEKTQGSKNIIIISDGLSCTMNCKAANGQSDVEQTLNLARTVAAQGGKVYTVGVLDDNKQIDPENEQFLKDLAQAGNGIYFRADKRNRLNILFGDPNPKQTKEDAFGLTILNDNHFITKDVSLTATMFGFNEVVPKPYASLLVTAGGGQPALTVWNYGVGRVSSLTTYNGQDYGELLIKGNSLLLSRTGNWLVGDPERKAQTVISVPQMHVGSPATIMVKSDRVPENAQLQFVPQGKDTYTATFTPTEQGYGTIGGMAYAASYPSEYEQVGMRTTFERELAVSKGRLFDPTDADGIVNHAATVRQLEEARLEPLRTPLLLLAALLFLFEILFRRIYEILRARSQLG